MVAAIITLVEITKLAGGSDITCKSYKAQLYADLIDNLRQIRFYRYMGHVRLLTPIPTLTI